MALYCPTINDYAKRLTSLFNTANNITWMAWARVNVIPPIGYNTVFALQNLAPPLNYTEWWGVYPTGTTNTDNADGKNSIAETFTITRSSPAAGTWVHYTLTSDAALNRTTFYVNNVIVATFTNFHLNNVTNVAEVLGGDGFGQGTIEILYNRVWTAVLFAGERANEMASPTVVRTSLLFQNTPLETDLLDISGNGRNWTQVGSPTFTTNTPFAPNAIPTSAIALGALPNIITLPIGTVGDLWYSYTPYTGQVIIGAFGIASLSDTITASVWLGPTSAPVNYLELDGIVNKPFEIPVDDGVTYYIKFTISLPLTVAATLSFINGPINAVPVGGIFVNDDVVGYRTGAIDPTNGVNYNVLQFFKLAATNSERGGDILTNGRFILINDDTSGVSLYNDQLVKITDVAGLVSEVESNARTCVGAQVFYLSRLATPNIHNIVRVDGSGIVTNTYDTGDIVQRAAAKNDESIIYVCQNLFANIPIKRFNTATLVFDADLIPGKVALQLLDLLVLGDDSILALYRNNVFGGSVVYRLDPTGVQLNSYVLGSTYTTTSGFQSLFHALDDPASFWVRLHDTNGTINSTFVNVRVSDGAYLSTVLQSTYDRGIFSGPATLTPLARFGFSLSCPSFILRVALPPGPPPSGGGGSGGTIIVIKVTVPVSTDTFEINASGGATPLVPATFSLANLGTQTFSGLIPGSGYSIIEPEVPLFTTTYTVSNASPNDNITVADGEVVTVTITNTKSLIGGIYKITPNKRFDTLWIDFAGEVTQDVKIPDPRFKTALLGD